MRFTKKNIILLACCLCLLFAAVKITRSFIADSKRSYYTVTLGNFEEVITCQGEINSVTPVEINLPRYLQKADEFRSSSSFKITRIVDEGTEVKKGDFVAQLDQNNLISNMRSYSQDLEKMVSDLNNA